MGPLQDKVVPSVNLLSMLKFRIIALFKLSSNIGKNTLLFNSSRGFIILRFEFIFLFIKDSACEIPVVLYGVIL